MYILTKDDEKFVLLPNKPVYTVGRLSTDLILQEDLSISRNHVRLHLPSEKNAVLQIEDLGSKYGTFLNNDIARNKQISPHTLTPLPVGFKVRFGGMTNIWQVIQMKLVSGASSLTNDQVLELTKILGSLGGSVSPNWGYECTHLTMNEEATVTVKLLHALLENKPIVTLAYWRKLLAAAQSIHVRKDWPQPDDYKPTNMDLAWRPERTTLFAHKTFVFMNRRHFEIYGAVVRKAGALCKDLNSGVRKTFLTKKDVIVIQYVPSTQSQSTETINSIQEILERAGLRFIQEFEIGMALMQCSTKEFCNPSRKLAGDSMPTTESMTSSFNCSVLVPNTEDSEPATVDPVSELVVPESDVYRMEPESDKTDSEPQVPKSRRQKRGRVITVGSSDEEQGESKKQKSLEVPTRGTAKAPLPVANESDDADDMPLSQFAKKPPEAQPLKKPAEISVQSNSSGKRANQPARIRVINFLEKSQPQASVPPQASQSQSQKQPGKRLHLELEQFNESDSDDCENLFNFADSKKKKKKGAEQPNEDSNDGLFNFHTQNQSDDQDQDQDHVQTEPFRPDVMEKPKSKYVVFKPKRLPRKVDTSGWLSCSRLHNKIKPEPNASANMEAAPTAAGDDVNLEQSIKETDTDEAHTNWVAAIQDNIQVRLMNITVRSHDDVDAAPDDSVSKPSGRKNYKKFVKQTILHRQKKIVPLQRLQLADGMVSAL